jgi:predicted glycosyltransferase
MQKIIDILEPLGRVYITSERAIPEEFSAYVLRINPLDIHHILSFTSLYIGDSQSMAVEAAMLGTPNVRISSFSGKISVLEELEHTYQLTMGIHPSLEQHILNTLHTMVENRALKSLYQERRQRMLLDKIDVTEWLINLFTSTARTER